MKNRTAFIFFLAAALVPFAGIALDAICKFSQGQLYANWLGCALLGLLFLYYALENIDK